MLSKPFLRIGCVRTCGCPGSRPKSAKQYHVYGKQESRSEGSPVLEVNRRIDLCGLSEAKSDNQYLTGAVRSSSTAE